ncbi:MAG: HAD-IA family hydrolase [Candidatus Thorarchaeota archaeon]
MPHRQFKHCSAISFDIGGTLIEPFFLPVFEVHKKFIIQVCDDDCSFSDEELTDALDVADEEAWELIPEKSVHYFFSEADWTERNRILLRTLGITKLLDERASHMQTLWTEIIAANPHKLKPDAKETLEQLKHRGYSLAISTNWEHPRELLKSFGIYDLFESIQFSIVPGYCKPSPYMLIQNAREMGVNPLKCAFIGDDIKRDIPAARRAGMHPILIVSEGREIPPDDDGITVIHKLNELLELFA